MSALSVEVRHALSLPTELLHIICSHLRRLDLPTFALVNTACNEICTPLLYRNIRIFDCSAAVQLSHTLRQPQNLFGRRLPTLVRTFWVCDRVSLISLHDATNDELDNYITFSIANMPNLETLRYRAGGPGWRTFAALLLRPHPRLKSVDITIWIHDGILNEVEQKCAVWEKKLPALPSLTDLSVYALSPLPPRILAVMGGILAAQSHAVTKFSFVCNGRMSISSVAPSLSTLPALQHLEVKIDEIRAPGFGHMSHIKSLSIVENFITPGPSDIILSPTQWPMLEKLVCDPSTVSIFLPVSSLSEHRRPIHTLQLNDVTYEHNWGRIPSGHTSSWKETIVAVARTNYSAAALRHLHCEVYDLEPQHLRRLASLLNHLETFVIAVTNKALPADVHELGQIILPTSPRLHTFLLSDGVLKSRGQNWAFSFARDLDLQKQWLVEYSRYSSALRRVAFTTEFEWEKGEDGVWYPSEFPSDKPVEHPHGHDNDDSDISDWDDDVFDSDDSMGHFVFTHGPRHN
ncbi:hypothetical protein C8Q70DRAFT_919959 [Cubamyces menziesii]|nr:hypothetical protein C8Q70DRAFT_919959 [Cubamyces menziesii]